MKKLGMLIILIACLMPACEEDKNENPDRYSFWKGDIENYYYLLDMNDQPLHLVKGKPYMILEYDPVSGVPIKCEFGLSEAHNVYMPGAEGAIPQPFISASSFDYATRLNLLGSVDLLINWENVSSYEELSGGGYHFWINKGNTRFNFVMTFDAMEGEMINNQPSWGDAYSDIKAFKLLRKFNSNTIGTN